MGDYGTIQIGINRPDVFSSIYALNPCCLSATGDRQLEGTSPWENVTTDEEFSAAQFPFKAVVATSAVWAPNPRNPPFYFDLPTKDGKPRPVVLPKLAANAPLAYIDQKVENVEGLNAIGLDAEDKARSIGPTTKRLHKVLDDYQIANKFEIYEGNHINQVAEHIETVVMPLFSEHLGL